MQKLLEKFKADQSEKNRERLQNYLIKHPFAIICAPREDQLFIKENGFKC